MSINPVMDAILARRAVRSYTDEKVMPDQVRLLLRAAVHAPTAMHAEPWVFIIIQDPAMLKELSDGAKALMLADEGTLAPQMTAQRRPPPQDVKSLMSDPEFNIFYDATTLIVVCGKPMGNYVDADCWLAAENIMLAAHAMGLGTCPIGLAVAVLNDPRTKAQLNMPPGVKAVAPIIVGTPRGIPSVVGRKEPEILSWV